MYDAGELPAGQETQAVAYVDDGVASSGFDKLPAFRCQREELEPPLRGEQECEGPDIRVLVVADVSGRFGCVSRPLFMLGVVEKAEC